MLDTIFLSVLNMSITALLVILGVLVTRLFLKKSPKIFSYALWAVVLFRLICPFSFESAIGFLPVREAPSLQTITANAPPEDTNGYHMANETVNSILSNPNKAGVESRPPLQRFIGILCAIWVMGILAMLFYSAVQLSRLKNKLIGAVPLKDNIYLADHISSPFVMGVLKPSIYLPSKTAESQMEFILRHEQHHIKRFDHITRILGFLALTIHWFNPLAWLAFILSGKDMEMSCDEAVLKQMKPDIRAEYSQSLLYFATGKALIGAAPLAFGEGDTKARVKNVMTYKKPMLWVSIIAFTAAACAALALMSHPVKEPVPKDSKAVSAERLWENRTEFTGNSSAVGNILSELSFPDNMQYKNFELQTAEPPYEIIVYFALTDDGRQTADNAPAKAPMDIDSKQLEENARIMFSLIGNAEKITFSVIRRDGGILSLTGHYMRNQYEELFTKTETYEEFQTVLDEIVSGKGTLSLAD